MRVIATASIDAVVPLRDLVESLRAGYRNPAAAPAAARITVERADLPAAGLALAPAWNDFSAPGRPGLGYLGVRIDTDFPGNSAHDRPDEMGVYVLMSGRTGEPLALIDGRSLAYRRAAATSALAAQYLARTDARRLMVIGAGNLAGHMVAAITGVRPVTEVLVWSRTRRKAEALAFRMRGRDYRIAATGDLREDARGADIIVCATSAADPVLSGAWVAPGTHVDLSGTRVPQRRQADDDLIRRGRVFVDTREALERVGDLVQAGREGLISPQDVAADLFELARGEKSGRRFDEQITVFAAAGSSVGDLAAAAHIFMRV